MVNARISAGLGLTASDRTGKMMTKPAASGNHAPRLGEGSLYERLRRHPAVAFDPHVAHAALIHDDDARGVLAAVHGEYLDIGRKYGLEMQAGTATWRAGRSRSDVAGFDVDRLNRDNVAFMQEIIAARRPQPIRLCGVLGPHGDAYRPEEGLDSDSAERFHRPQAEALAGAGADELAAFTMPALPEAIGIAAAMAATDLPYSVSFVIRSAGTLLDGTPIADAVARIDGTADPAPAAYLVNCVHPSVFRQAMETTRRERPGAAARIEGFQANTSARTPEELDGLEDIDTQAPEPFADAVAAVCEQFAIRLIGGCCGTTTAHMDAIARRLAT